MPTPTTALDPALATDPDRRMDPAQVRAFLCISQDRLQLLQKTGTLTPVERTGAGPRFRFGDVRAVARGERPMPAPGVVLAGGVAGHEPPPGRAMPPTPGTTKAP